MPPTASPIPRVERPARRRRGAVAAGRRGPAQRPRARRRPLPRPADRGDRRVKRPLADRTGAKLSAMLAAGETSAAAILASSQARIDAVDGEVRAFLTPTPQLAARARGGARRRTCRPERRSRPWRGSRSPSRTCSRPTGSARRAGPRSSRRYVPPYDATAWTRLSGAGAVLVGKTNCDEFAMGSSNENSAYGARAQPLGSRAGARRLERRLGGGGGGRRGGLGSRHRHRGQRAPARVAVRRRRAQADVRAHQSLRADRVRLLAGHGRHLHAQRAGRGLDAAGARRARSARCDLPGRAGARLRRRPRRWRGGAAGRRRRGGVRRRGRAGASAPRCAPRSIGSPRLGAEVGEVALPHAALRALRLLPDRAERVLLEPGPVRRRALRPRAPRARTPTRSR